MPGPSRVPTILVRSRPPRYDAYASVKTLARRVISARPRHDRLRRHHVSPRAQRGGVKPCRTTVFVELPQEPTLVEIDAQAVAT
ncbi:hypothetical protein ABZW30_34610 [Kitasatospora sp. NPDC004669]|uniref:hypothetical protein n=1 Tax=Kitasatospora sp. NPDC004669 TaxID=3154555 RepID=UPI0033A82EE7